MIDTRRATPRENAHANINAVVYERTGLGVQDMDLLSREVGHVLDEYEYHMVWRSRWAFLVGLAVANLTWIFLELAR